MAVDQFEDSNSINRENNIKISSEKHEERNKNYCCVCGKSCFNLLDLIKHESEAHISSFCISELEEIITELSNVLKELKLKQVEIKENSIKRQSSEKKSWGNKRNTKKKETSPTSNSNAIPEIKIENNESIPSNSHYVCNICNKMYEKKQRLHQHMVRNHMGVKTHCHICGKYYKDLDLHIKDHETDPEYICDICGFKCRGKLHYITHKKRKHKDLPKRFFCSTCGIGYHYAHELKRHELAHDPNPEKKFFCPVCGKGFSRKFTMTKHARAHTERHECSHCGKMLRRKSDLMFHLKTQHSDYRDFKEMCSLCDASFTMKRYLKRHMQYKHGAVLDE